MKKILPGEFKRKKCFICGKKPVAYKEHGLVYCDECAKEELNRQKKQLDDTDTDWDNNVKPFRDF
jgi:hypothetical protein